MATRAGLLGRVGWYGLAGRYRLVRRSRSRPPRPVTSGGEADRHVRPVPIPTTREASAMTEPSPARPVPGPPRPGPAPAGSPAEGSSPASETPTPGGWRDVLRRPRAAARRRARGRLRGRARPAATRARHDRPALMARHSRLDAELVRRGLARSREHAVTLIAEGRVAVGGRAATKPATGVDAGTPVVVRTDPDAPSWVSRGAHKLLGALEAFPVTVSGRRALDAGASTGGFTEVLLSRGAAEVVAVDVGYGELAWSLRTDERVRRARAHQRAHPDAGGDRRPRRPRRRRPVLHLAAARPARADRLRRRRRRPAADGQAAVRGGP